LVCSLPIKLQKIGKNAERTGFRRRSLFNSEMVCVEYSPQLAKKFASHKKVVGKNWRMDETYIKVKGIWHYLYRAVDKTGYTIDFYL
jgi:hypothetical protein